MRPVEVSVVVPTHRRETLVVRAIESALAQEAVSIEVIVLDDTAEGSAREAVGALGDQRVRYVKRETPSGGRPALARNEGTQLARGEFVHFLDDDDELVAGGLRALRAPLLASPSLAVSYGVVLPFGDNPQDVARERAYFDRAAAAGRRSRSRRDVAREILFGVSPLICSSCMIRRDTLGLLGGFDTSMTVCEDFELFLRAIRAHGGVFVDAPVLRHRTGLPSLSRAATEATTLAAYRTIYASYKREFGAPEFLALRVFARLKRAWPA